MLPNRIATESIKVLAPSVRTDYGKQIDDWAHPVVAAVVGHCSVQPEQSTEIIDGREATVWRMRVWAPPGAPVTATSRIGWRGQVYRVVGHVLPWIDPTAQGLDHITFTMTASEG